ncbi:MAG: hypothetical protein QXN59_03010 [Candidatus Micrarchaeaceae archaeon]
MKEEKIGPSATNGGAGAAEVQSNGAEQKKQGPKSINELVKESGNAEAKSIKDKIDAMKKERGELIYKIKDLRRRIMYKQAEGAAIEKFLEKERKSGEGEKKKRKIGYLRRVKSELEFKVATEAGSLAAEKALVRKIAEVNAELNEALKSVKMERKSGLIKEDIKEYTEKLQELNKKVLDMDREIDGLYRDLRKSLNIPYDKTKNGQQKPERRPQPKLVEINLEDIAVIKRRGEK